MNMSKTQAFGKLPHLLTFPFRGQGWFGKLSIAAGVTLLGSIIPIAPTVLLMGYLYELMRRIIIDGEEAALPEWDDWGGYFMNGLKLFGAVLIVVVPFILIFMVVAVLYFVPVFLIESNGSADWFGLYIFVLMFANLAAVLFGVIFMTFAMVFAPVYLSHLVAENDFKAIFQIKAWWQIFKHGFWEFFIAFMLMFGVNMIIGYFYAILIYSVVCCCLLPFAAAYLNVYIVLLYLAMVASAYRDGRNKQEAVVPPTLDDGGEEDQLILPEEEESGEEEATQLVNDEPSMGQTAPLTTRVTSALVMPEPEPAPEPAEEPEAEAESGPEFDLPDPDGGATMLVTEDRPALEVPPAGFAASTVKADDLKKINGIGPKTAMALNAAGILSFAQLAETPVEDLRRILTDAGLDILVPNCGNWLNQARDRM
jgi:predicted flap endonuclease-1-like 5' DNA nuclease